MLSFTVSEAHYVAAIRLMQPGWQQRWKIMLAVAATVAVLGLAAAQLGYRRLALVVLGSGAGGIIGIVVGGAVERMLLAPRARRIWRQQRDLHETGQVSWDDDGLHYRSALGTSTLPWAHVRELRENELVFILLVSDALSQILPKSAFADDAEQAAFRALARARICADP